MLRIMNLSIPLSYQDSDLYKIIAKKANLSAEKILKVKLVRKSIDARDKGDIHFVMTLDFSAVNEDAVLKNDKRHLLQKVIPSPKAPMPVSRLTSRPIIVGAGPAGMFAALTFAKAGARPILIERGKPVEEREKDVQSLREHGILNADSNVQFGEGGAGTFSDGKLTTGIKSSHQRTVLETFVENGAPEEILWEQKPHIGTDILRNVIISMRKQIISLGGEVHFNTKLTRLIIRNNAVAGISAVELNSTQSVREVEFLSKNVFLALGHSSRDTLPELLAQGVFMSQKPFAMGVRIEHRQRLIDLSQYGSGAGRNNLPAAVYKLAVHTPDERGVYTFCMCPGGQVIPSASEIGCVVTNGMSKYARDEENANSAVLVGIKTSDFHSDNPLAGMELQREIERKAFVSGGGGYKAPVQLVGDFLRDRASTRLGEVVPSYKPGYTLTDLRSCLPQYITENLKFGLARMDRQLNGFAAADAILTGVESRTSSPVRLNREKDYSCCTISGLYPIGEGAGYAGGIVSAAVDGISAALAVLEK